MTPDEYDAQQLAALSKQIVAKHTVEYELYVSTQNVIKQRGTRARLRLPHKRKYFVYLTLEQSKRFFVDLCNCEIIGRA